MVSLSPATSQQPKKHFSLQLLRSQEPEPAPRGIKFARLEEDTPLSFLFALVEFKGTVLRRIYPQLLLVVLVSVLAWFYCGTEDGTCAHWHFPYVAHALFGRLYKSLGRL